jgi:hypothetical protein
MRLAPWADHFRQLSLTLNSRCASPVEGGMPNFRRCGPSISSNGEFEVKPAAKKAD